MQTSIGDMSRRKHTVMAEVLDDSSANEPANAIWIRDPPSVVGEWLDFLTGYPTLPLDTAATVCGHPHDVMAERL